MGAQLLHSFLYIARSKGALAPSFGMVGTVQAVQAPSSVAAAAEQCPPPTRPQARTALCQATRVQAWSSCVESVKAPSMSLPPFAVAAAAASPACNSPQAAQGGTVLISSQTHKALALQLYGLKTPCYAPPLAAWPPGGPPAQSPSSRMRLRRCLARRDAAHLAHSFGLLPGAPDCICCIIPLTCACPFSPTRGGSEAAWQFAPRDLVSGQGVAGLLGLSVCVGSETRRHPTQQRRGRARLGEGRRNAGGGRGRSASVPLLYG